jgi:hypothetical protein
MKITGLSTQKCSCLFLFSGDIPNKAFTNLFTICLLKTLSAPMMIASNDDRMVSE